ncbi:hypothetical protein EAH84_14150 [Sphingomonas oligophenolica]|uniref:Purine permease n=2 Tax=Sphingomonas oligophenolica TaxID=301154 RepID=A0A502C6X0_9SPHN|nr:hypothetical protein EAH84_14150 [Sphingomonas oligophenolica]
MGLQNVFVMTGVFVFPGILGRSFHLPPEVIADLYTATFIGCGVTTLLMAGVIAKFPLIAGPYAGVFAALVTFGHMPGSDLGAAFGSLCAASLAWCLLTIPIRGKSVVMLLATAVRNPVITGSIVMLVMMQIADLTFPHWIGKPGDPTFPLVNLGCGLVTAVVLVALIISPIVILRRLSLLIALGCGTLVFEMFATIDFGAVVRAPWFVMPHLFAFGFSFNFEYALVFFLVLVAVNIQTIALMSAVGEWAEVPVTPARHTRGILSMMLGSALASTIGTFSMIPYPACVALLRSTRVASRYVTMATGALLIAIGFCSKIDFLFVVLPVPLLGAAATVLFGMVFLHSVEMLSHVEWEPRRLAITGFALMLGFGCNFLEPEVLKPLPLVVALLLQQPTIVGVTTMIVLGAIIPKLKPPITHHVGAEAPFIDPATVAEPQP